MLLSLLSDIDWKVRFEAAKTLAHFNFIDLEHLKKMKEEQADPLAIEVLEHTIAEREFT